MNASAATVAGLLKKSGAEIESEVRGASMFPTLMDGSRIRIRCGAATCEPGDIVALLVDPPIAHRVVATCRHRSRRYVITRGDASWFCDAPVTQNQIIGVVTAHDAGRGWSEPDACTPPVGPAAILAWLSRRSVLTALRVSERLALLVARAGASIASRWGGRA